MLNYKKWYIVQNIVFYNDFGDTPTSIDKLKDHPLLWNQRESALSYYTPIELSNPPMLD